MNLPIKVIRPEQGAPRYVLTLAVVLVLCGRSAWPQLPGPHISSVVWSPDSKRLATMEGSMMAVKVWDVDTGKELRSLSLNLHSGVSSITWSPDVRRLATASQDNAVEVWDAESGNELLTLGNRHAGFGSSGSLSSVAWSPDGKRLATGTGEPPPRTGDLRNPFDVAKVWDANTGKELLSLGSGNHYVSNVIWSPDGKRLAGIGRSGVKVWDADSGKELSTPIGHTGPTLSMAWSPDGKRLLASADRTASVWDAQSGKELQTLSGHHDYISSVTWSPDGKRLITASYDGTAKLWDAQTGQELLTLSSHSGRLFAVAWSPDGSRLATGSDCSTVKVWNAKAGRELRTLEGSQGCEGLSDTGGPTVSLAIAIALPDASSFYIPALGDGEMLGVIPVSNSRFAGVRIIPHMGTASVTINVSALPITGRKLSQATGEEIGAWQSEDAGSYQGKQGESLSLSGLARLGLPVLDVHVVHARRWLPTPGGAYFHHPYADSQAYCECGAMAFVLAEKCVEFNGHGQCCRVSPPSGAGYTSSKSPAAAAANGGPKRIYSAAFEDWPLVHSQYGSIKLGFGNTYVLSPSSNTWLGPGRPVVIPPLEGGFVLDVRFRILERHPSASLNFELGGTGDDAHAVNVFLDVWSDQKADYTLEEGLLKRAGLPMTHYVVEERLAERTPLAASIVAHNWSDGGKITLKREGGRMAFLVNDELIKDFAVTPLPFDEIALGAALPSTIEITSIEAVQPGP